MVLTGKYELLVVNMFHATIEFQHSRPPIDLQNPAIWIWYWNCLVSYSPVKASQGLIVLLWTWRLPVSGMWLLIGSLNGGSAMGTDLDSPYLVGHISGRNVEALCSVLSSGVFH